jgi:hypothetical protein
MVPIYNRFIHGFFGYYFTGNLQRQRKCIPEFAKLYNAAGTYNLVIKDGNGCTDDADYLSISTASIHSSGYKTVGLYYIS